jgi:protein-arginine kinase
MDLAGYQIDGVNESGHVYKLKYSCGAERAERVRDEIIAQELNARIRLFEEMPRVFGDSLCRALAILKNARLLSSGELFDLLSPLRLAAMEKMLDGITLRGVESLIASIDIYNKEDTLDQRQRDKIDAARADDMNSRFEDVVVNDAAEGRFL